MAYTYRYEYLGECYEREVTQTDLGDTYHYYDGYNACCGNYRDEWTDHSFRYTIPTSAPVDIKVYFSYWIHYDDPWNSYENFNTSYATIPAGQTGVTFTFYGDWQRVAYQDFRPGGGCARENTNIYDHTFLEQPEIPSVCNDPDCSLGFTGITSTPPTQRGDDDGTIYAGVTGASGNTVTWYLNTVENSPTGDTHTFTGLTAGEYYIKAEISSGCSVTQLVTVNQGEFRTGDFGVTSPTDSVKAVENPILLSLRTALNSTSPAYSVNTFTIDGTISGVTIDFSLTFPYLYEAQFQSKGFPDRANYFVESVLTNKIGTPIGTNTLDEITTSLAECFQKDAIISRLYYISSSGTSITLTAKEYGEGYDLDVSNVTITGSNLTLTNVTPGVSQYDGQIVSDYSLYTELFVDDYVNYGLTPVITDYRRILELELPFSPDNNHQFDLSSTLKNFVTSEITSITFTGYTTLPEYISGYFCRYGEKYPLVENTNTKKKRYKGVTDYGYCCNAALNFEDDNDMTGYFPASGYTTISGITFLNTAPNNKYSHRNGVEIMYFVLPYGYTAPISVYGNVYMFSGIEYLGVKFMDITTGTTTWGGVYAINVSYSALGLSSYEIGGEKIRKVDIQVYQNGYTGTTYTELKSYLFEIDEQPDNFNVAFLSKLGTYETYSFYGEVIEGQEINRDLYQKSFEVDAYGAADEGFQYNSVLDTDYTKTWVVNTGIINEDNFNYLQGLLQSNRIYHYDDVHKNYLIPTAQTATKSTNTNEYSLQITFRETISENQVTQ